VDLSRCRGHRPVPEWDDDGWGAGSGWGLSLLGLLVLIAAVLVLGQHLRSLLLAWTDPLALTGDASSPTPSGLVQLMDVKIIVPVMEVVMALNADPDSSPGLTTAFPVLALVFVALAGALYHPPFRRRKDPW